MRPGLRFVACGLAAMAWLTPALPAASPSLDAIIDAENAKAGIPTAAPIDDLAFLRRVSVDLIGRIPTDREIRTYLSWSEADRRAKVVDTLMADPRFAQRWGIFFADLFRIRANAPGGAALTRFVRDAVAEDMPYDELCRKLISANGRPDRAGEVGFILADEADPMALAGVTSQVFLGVRIACAQCHDHPFDEWEQTQFYGLAAFFGKTRRVEARLTRQLYTMEVEEMAVKWPPEDRAKGQPRKPVTPEFPFVIEGKPTDAHIVSYKAARTAREKALAAKAKGGSGNEVDDLLAAADRATKPKLDNVVADARQSARDLKVEADLRRDSDLRRQLSEMVTDPRNRYFSRNLVNRLWFELVGRGFVMPVDDFRAENPPVHEKALDKLANDFVASGFDFRTAVRMIVTSAAYQRGRLDADTKPSDLRKAETYFASAPTRRMLGEVLYDSLVTAGHMFDYKYPPGMHKKVIRERVTAYVKVEGKNGAAMDAMQAMNGPAMSSTSGYDLESALELPPDQDRAGDGLNVDAMRQMAKADIDAQMKAMNAPVRRREVSKFVERVVDDNPRFSSSLSMPSPAPPAHFFRVFGQTDRANLGEGRDHSPSMRQALLMLNGKLTNEAARVGPLEPMHKLLSGPKADLSAAVKLAYREILTRDPQSQELAEGLELLQAAGDPLEGMADLRWVLLNCHEFRFIP